MAQSRTSSHVLLLLLLIAQAAAAQVAAGISGRVQDPSGAGMSGVAVTVKNLETGATRAVTSTDGGDFRSDVAACGTVPGTR